MASNHGSDHARGSHNRFSVGGLFEKADSDIVDALVENSVNLPPAEVVFTTEEPSAAQEIDLEARASSRLQLALDFNDGDLTVNASESRLFRDRAAAEALR